MRRPWQIWSAYVVSLVFAVLVLVWLTGKVLRLDTSERQARRQAELEEVIGSALWRMDVELTRLLASEVGRPVSAFYPFIRGEGKAAELLPSPLLVQPSELVLLHFQIDGQGSWTSPQCPRESQYELALANGSSLDNLSVSRQRLQEISRHTDRDRLLASLPDQMIDQGPPPNNLASNLGLSRDSVPLVNPYNNDAQQRSFQQQEDLAQQLAQLPAQQAERPSRRQQEFNSRANSLQIAAQQSMLDQRLLMLGAHVEGSQGLTQPLWQGDRLLLARRVQINGQLMIQGCWLDWAKIRVRLLEDIADLLPEADLVPVQAGEQHSVGRLLATLPARLVTPPAVAQRALWTPMTLALVVAWACLVAAAGAVALLLHGVVQLSERRAAFVSAVTHEMRTPLTTFRMYSEMLSQGMIADPDKRRTYLETLRVESERLAHLVENVLQYARLERTSPKWQTEQLTGVELLERLRPRMEDRAGQAGMTLSVACDEDATAAVETDPGAVEQILFNFVDNACKYAVRAEPPRIDVRLESAERGLRFSVRDYGPGIDEATRRRLFRPFWRPALKANTAPGVGLGLALCRRLARQLGGRLTCHSRDPGAEFSLWLPAESSRDAP